MKFPQFIKKTCILDNDTHIFQYHLPVTYSKFLANSLCNFAIDYNISPDVSTFLSQNNISAFGACDENTILYTIALKILGKQKSTTQKKCFLVYFDQPEAIQHIQQNAETMKVEWCNTILFTQGDDFCQYFGIQSPKIFLDSVDYFDKDLSNRYFCMAEIHHENIQKFTKIYVSDVTNWFFIFYEVENEQSLKSMMSNEHEKPSLESFLEKAETIVNIQIGGDEGYLDYVLIQSKENMEDLIHEIEQEQKKFIENYQNLIKNCVYDDDWHFDMDWQLELYKQGFFEITQIIR